MVPILFVLLPLILFLPMFAYETYVAFRRIGKPLDKGGAYLHATWEITHTFLILSVNYFIWFYNSAIVDVGMAVAVPLMIYGFTFAIRAALYMYLFYAKSPGTVSRGLDILFALTHVVILAALLYTVVAAAFIMLGGSYEPNNALPGLIWPGLVFTVPLVVMPIYFQYRTKKK